MTDRRTGKPFIAQSAAYKDYCMTAGYFLTPRPQSPVSTPCEVKCLFYLPARRKTDLTNLLEAIDDILVECGILADDNSSVIVSHDGSRVLYDKEKPRTEVTITAFKEE